MSLKVVWVCFLALILEEWFWVDMLGYWQRPKKKAFIGAKHLVAKLNWHVCTHRASFWIWYLNVTLLSRLSLTMLVFVSMTMSSDFVTNWCRWWACSVLTTSSSSTPPSITQLLTSCSRATKTHEICPFGRFSSPSPHATKSPWLWRHQKVRHMRE